MNLDRHQLKMVENWGMICGFNKDSDYLHDCGSLGAKALDGTALFFFGKPEDCLHLQSDNETRIFKRQILQSFAMCVGLHKGSDGRRGHSP